MENEETKFLQEEISNQLVRRVYKNSELLDYFKSVVRKVFKAFIEKNKLANPNDFDYERGRYGYSIILLYKGKRVGVASFTRESKGMGFNDIEQFYGLSTFKRTNVRVYGSSFQEVINKIDKGEK